MTSGFVRVRFHVVDQDIGKLRAVGARGLAYRRGGESKDADEAAARYYLSQVLSQDERPTVRRSAAPRGTKLVPDMRSVVVQEEPLTKTRQVQFEQTQESIPVFGSRIVVELDQNRELIAVTGGIADVKGVSEIPAFSPKDALRQIAELAKIPESSIETAQVPELVFFHDDESDTWHLAYFFKKVPAAPQAFLAEASKRQSHGHGLGLSPRQRQPRLNYLVDAHNGAVLYYYSATPMLDIPSECKGVDELNKTRKFWGRKVGDGFEMTDPMQRIKTYDHQLKDLATDPLPTQPVSHAANDWSVTNKAAVSAHVNATNVFSFFNSVLMRKGIDDKGMELVSIVNCTYSDGQLPPEWHNAMWYDGRMWYGQDKRKTGELQSYARFLDIIAHELTHGVTEYTSDLVYSDQSGALNESFSDIFGVIIKNWYEKGADSSVDRWDWEIGPGLGQNGLPLRDMSNPQRTGDPDHMDKYLYTHCDNGGVHTNSNIHNKAAYNVLTATGEDGERVFTPREVAVLYYLALCRLSSLAKFPDVLETLVDVAKIYWAGDEQQRKEKIKHIQDAYQRVGITMN